MSNISRDRRSIGWSGAYLLISRASALATVPILLHALGAGLYAAWVLSSSLVFAQGLVDFGLAAAVARFVAIARAEERREGVVIVIVRGSLFYTVLSLLVGGALWLLSGPMAALIHGLPSGRHADAITLLHYGAVLFVLTNATMLASAVLQGCDRVDAAYRAQALGSAALVPLLVVAMSLTAHAVAAGLSAVVMYLLQLLLLLPACRRALAAIPSNPGRGPSLLEMLRVGSWWQVSSWADFATFQAPRLAAAFALPAPGVVTIDLALRFGQAAATPLFATFPLVLPRSAETWAVGGRPALGRLISPWMKRGIPALLLWGAAVVPLSPFLIARWGNLHFGTAVAIGAAVVVVGVLAHASTGLLSSVLLAVAELRLVAQYKAAQLIAVMAALGVGTRFGTATLCVAIASALVVPAVWFNVRATGSILSEGLDGIRQPAGVAAQNPEVGRSAARNKVELRP